jgi:multidrug resistance efflux pump
MAPEVAGRIVGLPVVDNQYVRKGDLLVEIDPTNYQIAVRQGGNGTADRGQRAEHRGASRAAGPDEASKAQVDQAQPRCYSASSRRRHQDSQRCGTVQNAQLWARSSASRRPRSGADSVAPACGATVALNAPPQR